MKKLILLVVILAGILSIAVIIQADAGDTSLDSANDAYPPPPTSDPENDVNLPAIFNNRVAEPTSAPTPIPDSRSP